MASSLAIAELWNDNKSVTFFYLWECIYDSFAFKKSMGSKYKN